MTTHPAESLDATWRCRHRSEVITLGDLTSPAEVCYLPAGHDGWHRADSGNTWRNA